MNRASSQQKWELTGEAWKKFLSRLDPNPERAGEEYKKLHRDLVRYFVHHGRPSPEDFADKTINIVIKKVDEGEEEIANLGAYAKGVARIVLKKSWGDPTIPIEDLPPTQIPDFTPLTDGPERRNDEARYECAKRCWKNLRAEERKLLQEWHCGEGRERIENRKKLVGRRGIKIEKLRSLIFNIKQKLLECRIKCLEKEIIKKTRGMAK